MHCPRAWIETIEQRSLCHMACSVLSLRAVDNGAMGDEVVQHAKSDNNMQRPGRYGVFHDFQHDQVDVLATAPICLRPRARRDPALTRRCVDQENLVGVMHGHAFKACQAP